LQAHRQERREHSKAIHDLARGNIVGAMVHEQRAAAAHNRADFWHSAHSHHHHHHHGGGAAVGAAMTAAAFAAGAAAASAAAAPQPTRTVVVPVAGLPAPAAYPPPAGAYYPPQPLPAGGAYYPPQQPRVSAPQYSYSPGYAGQPSAGLGPDGRPLFAILQPQVGAAPPGYPSAPPAR
jgi:hypothetical protein